MKRIVMAIMAVAVAVTFSAPAFAGDPPKDTTKEEKKAPKHMVYGEGDKKKEEKKGGQVVVYGDEKKDEKKPVEPGK
jgi:hypothetical protein